MILLETARYGRMNIGRCVETPMGYIGCYRDVLLLADRRCSGKRLCEIHIPNAEFESTRPCLRELKSYLEISYICIPGNSNSANYFLLNAALYDNNYCVIKNSRGRAYCRQDLQPHKPGNQSIIDNATTTYLILHIFGFTHAQIVINCKICSDMWVLVFCSPERLNVELWYSVGSMYACQ